MSDKLWERAQKRIADELLRLSKQTKRDNALIASEMAAHGLGVSAGTARRVIALCCRQVDERAEVVVEVLREFASAARSRKLGEDLKREAEQALYVADLNQMAIGWRDYFPGGEQEVAAAIERATRKIDSDLHLFALSLEGRRRQVRWRTAGAIFGGVVTLVSAAVGFLGTWQWVPVRRPDGEKVVWYGNCLPNRSETLPCSWEEWGTRVLHADSTGEGFGTFLAPPGAGGDYWTADTIERTPDHREISMKGVDPKTDKCTVKRSGEAAEGQFYQCKWALGPNP